MPDAGIVVRPTTLDDVLPLALAVKDAFAGEPLHESRFQGAPNDADYSPAEKAAMLHDFRVARLTAGVRRMALARPGGPPPAQYWVTATLPATVAGESARPVGFAVWVPPTAASTSTSTPAAPPADGPSADGPSAKGLSAEEEEKQAQPPRPPPILNRAADDAILAGLSAACSSLFGAPSPAHAWYLTSLAVDPAAQGRGAGAALIRWGTALADAGSSSAGAAGEASAGAAGGGEAAAAEKQQPLDCYVESSEAGLRAYERTGFTAAAPWIEFAYGGRRLPMIRRGGGAPPSRKD